MQNGSKTIVDLVLRDHEKVKSLFAGVDVQGTDQLEDYFCNLREELVRHEVAEELVVYPAFRKHVSGADAVADACLAEQSSAEDTMSELEHEQPDTEAFRARLRELRAAVLEHAQHEERDIFPALANAVGEAELVQLGERYERALQMAPTHPHPHAPDTPPGNRVLGPVAALVDRMRDVMHAA